MDEHELGPAQVAIPTDVARTIDRNYLKLTADKIIQALATARNSASRANRRWIWELMQNAKDVPNRFGRVRIAIELQNDTLTFRHNGDAFDVDHLAGLIQQVSSKPSDGSDPDTIGKFGTGFVATHLLADVIQLTGLVKRPGDLRRRFRLTLDRSASTSEALQASIRDGLDWLRRIDDECELSPDYEVHRREENLDTAFCYRLTTTENRAAAAIGIDDLVHTLPATLVNLPEITEVQVRRADGSQQHFRSARTQIDDIVSRYNVEIEDSRAAPPQALHFLAFETPTLRLLARLDDPAGKALVPIPDAHPRLYRGFPLVGSEKFHFPFILAGHAFFPTEQRDGLLLNGKMKEAARNREILHAAVDAALTFTDWLIAYGATNLHVLADTRLPHLELDDDARDQFAARQRAWRSGLLERALVETVAGPVKLRDARIPRSHLGADAIANAELRRLVVALRGPRLAPREDLIAPWLAALGPDHELPSWELPLLITTGDLVTMVANAQTLTGLSLADGTDKHAWLNRLHHFLATQGLASFLDSHAIVPDQKGTFQTLSGLHRERPDDLIPAQLLDVLAMLGTDWRATLLDRAITVTIPTSRERGLREASQEINQRLQLVSKDPQRVKLCWDACIAILRLTSPGAKDDSYRRQLFTFARELMHFKEERKEIENLENLQYGTVTRLVTMGLNHRIAAQKTTVNLGKTLGRPEPEARAWLGRYLATVDGSEEHKPHLTSYAVVPNRLGNLCLAKDLQAFGTKDQPLDDTLVEILKDLDPAQDLRPKLLADGISLPLTPYTFDTLGNALMRGIAALAGKEEAYREPLLRLIKWRTENEALCDRYLSQFKEDSKTLFFKLTLAGSSSGEQIMQIMLKPELIPDLAELAALDPDNLEKLMVHARRAAQDSASFRHLQRIGATMERLFRQALMDAGVTATILFRGKGAWDFEIVNPSNERKFYIELKSWRISEDPPPIRMAISQAMQAGTGDRPYALCVVGRHDGVEDTTPEDIQANLLYLKDLAEDFAAIAGDIRFLRGLETSTGEIRLDVPGIDETKVLLSHSFIQRYGRPFAELIADIHAALS